MRVVFAASLLVLSLVANSTSAAEPPFTATAFTPDGKLVVAASQAGVHVFDWPDLKPRRVIKSAASNLHALKFSPNGKQLAVGGGNPAEEGMVEVFSWPDAKPVSTVGDHSDSVRSIAWVDNSRLLSASLDREVQLLRWQPKESLIRKFSGHSRSVNSICLLPGGKTLISTGVDQSVRVWELESGKLIRSLNQHTRPVHALALRPGAGRLSMVASAAADRTIRFWQPTIGRMVRYIRLDAEPLDIAWFDGTRIVASCVDGSIRVIDADEVQVRQTVRAIKSWAYSISVHSSDGSVVIAGSNGKIRRVVIRRGLQGDGD